MGGVTHLLLLLCVGVTVSTAEDLQKRVIGGKKCGDKERLYHVKLVDENNNFVCGGSLITDQWVLTAAHCKKGAKKAVLEVHPGRGQPGQTPVKSVIRKKFFKKHDIMLWKLPDPTNVKHVNLPKDCPRPQIDKVQIAGHGSSAESCSRCKPHERRTNDLQCADLKVVDCPLFQQNRKDPKWPRDRVFCGDTTNADACYGDSGGGVVYNNIIYGVILGGGNITCTEPVKFMDVCSYMNWINKTITEQTGCFRCG